MGRKEQSAQTRARLLLAAATTFELHGFHGASLQQVADTAQLTKGALYFHFRSKEDLAIAVMQEQYRRWPERVERYALRDQTALQTVIDLTSEVAEGIMGDPIVRVGVRLVFETRITEQLQPRPFVGWIAIIAELLDRAREEGDLADGLDTAAVAEVIVGAFTGVQLISAVVHDRGDVLERIASMWAVLLPGLTASGTFRGLRLPGSRA